LIANREELDAEFGEPLAGTIGEGILADLSAYRNIFRPVFAAIQLAKALQ
jgi:hypothetical protein